MADPSEDRPFPMENLGSGSRSGDQETTRDPPVIPSSGNDGGRTPPLHLLPLVAHPPMEQPSLAQAGHSGGRPAKKKAKMGKEAAAGTTQGGLVEEPGKKRKSASLENLPKRARTCGICRREFATARALFGHMRCHPERRWRGAHPPPVSPRREVEGEPGPERPDVELTRQAEAFTSSLLNIGQTMLRKEKFKAMEGYHAGGSGGSGNSATAAVVSGQGMGVEIGWMKNQERVVGDEDGRLSSGDAAKDSKRKKDMKSLNCMDEDCRRKHIHYQLDLNKEAPLDDEDEDDDNDKDEAPDTTFN